MKPKMILIEGPEGAGKLTLINALAPINASLIKNKKFKTYESAFNQYENQIMAAKYAKHLHIVNGSYVSEIIYGKLINGYDIPQVVIKLLESKFLNLPTLVIFCLPSYDTTYKNWKEKNRKGDSFVKDSATFRTSYQMFERSPNLSNLPYIICDYTTMENFKDKLIHMLLSR